MNSSSFLYLFFSTFFLYGSSFLHQTSSGLQADRRSVALATEIDCCVSFCETWVSARLFGHVKKISFRKWEGVVRTGWSWLRIGTGGGHF